MIKKAGNIQAPVRKYSGKTIKSALWDAAEETKPSSLAKLLDTEPGAGASEANWHIAMRTRRAIEIGRLIGRVSAKRGLPHNHACTHVTSDPRPF